MTATGRAVILNVDGCMLIVRRSQSDPRYPGSWDLPGGRHEDDESIEATAVRETLEEVGIQLDNPQLLFATSDVRNGESKTWVFYAARVPTDTLVTLSYEHDDYKWIKPADLPKYTPYEILLRLHAHIIQDNLLARI